MSEESKQKNADWLIKAAHTLKEAGETDKAETCYMKALTWTPDNADLALETATFLYRVQAKYGDAEEMLRKSVEKHKRAEDMVRLAGLLLCLCKTDEGISTLNQALEIKELDKEKPQVALEGLFYAVLHMPADQQKSAYERLRSLVQSGAKAPGMDIAANLNRARADDHPGIAQLQQLLDLVTHVG